MVEIPHLPLSSQTQIPKPFETYWQPTHSPLLWTHFWSCIWIFETKLGFEIFQCDCVLLLQAFDAWLLFKPRKRYDSRGRWAIKGGHPAWSRSENHGSFRRISSLKRFAPKDFKYNFLSLFVFFLKVKWMKLNMAQGGILLENTYTTTMKLQPLQCGVPEADDSLSLTFAYIARRTYLRVFFFV